MHDELIDHDEAVRAAEQALDARVVAALEVQPRVQIPADFAARVASQVAMRPANSLAGLRLRSTRYGYAVGLVSMVILLVAMLAYAPLSVAGSMLRIGVEWALCLQFVLLAVWFGLRRERLR